MRRFLGLAATALLTAACSGSATPTGGSGGTASVELDGTTYAVKDVVLALETGESAWFSIDGEPVAHANEDCVPGLSGGLDLYGDLPSSVKKPIDLVGERLKVDFTGDGDEANFCFVGMGGLAGAEDAWVRIDSVSGDRVSFTLSGTFSIYDPQGGEIVKTATAKGTAVVRAES